MHIRMYVYTYIYIARTVMSRNCCLQDPYYQCMYVWQFCRRSGVQLPAVCVPSGDSRRHHDGACLWAQACHNLLPSYVAKEGKRDRYADSKCAADDVTVLDMDVAID